MMTKENKRFWLTLFLEVLIALGIFLALTEYQARDMLAKGSPVAALEGPTLEGGSYQMNAELDKAPLHLVYFFAPWCTVCDMSIGNLNLIRNQYPESELTISIVALDYQTVNEVAEFINDHDLPMPVILGDRSWQQAFNIKGFPSYYLE